MENVICLTVGEFQENTYLVKQNDGLLIFDPGDRADYIIQEISKTNLQPLAILLTHGHLDHVGAISKLKQQYKEIKVYLSRADFNHLGKGSYQFQYDDFARSGMEYFVEKMLDNTDLPSADEVLPENNYIFNNWYVISTPGHTKGSCCFYNKELRVLISGDTLFYNSYGRTDLFSGNESEMMDSLKKLLKLPPDTLVFPGHGITSFEISKINI